MKNILCLNTCFRSAEIVVAGERAEFERVDANCKHSEHVLPEVEKVLERANLGAKDVDVLGVCVGPGSFTGIRIGVALVKGFGFSRDLPCVAFNSFEIIAEQYFLQNSNANEVVVVLDGLGGFVFVSKLERGGKTLVDPTCLSQEDMAEFIKQNSCEYVCHEDDKNKFALKSVELTQAAYENVLKQKLLAEKTVSCAEISPLYLRKSQAEVELEKKNENK